MENITGNTLLKVRGMAIGHDGKIFYRDVSFDVRKGDCIMLCGANGSGKTTLLRAIAGMKARSGKGSNGIVMIPSRIPKVKGFTLRDFVRISCYSQSDLGGRLAPEDEAAIGNALSRLCLDNLAGRDISTLSDGEFQKAAIASALVRRAPVILLDEPTAFLDAENRIAVMGTLKEICGMPGRPAVIFSTHDLAEGLAVCGKVLALGADGIFRCACADGKPDEMQKAVAGIFKNPDAFIRQASIQGEENLK